MDLRVDGATDLLIQGGDLVLVKNRDAIAQHVRMRLQTWMGESVYDENGGTPYTQVIFAAGTSDDAIRFILETRTNDTPGVTGCAIQVVADRETRAMTATGTATTVDGDVTFSVTLSPESQPVTVATS